jgi:hypothetical protein
MELESIERSTIRFKEVTAFLLATITILFVGLLLSFVPNELDMDAIAAKFVVDPNEFVAEHSEMLQYMVCTVTFPIFYILYVLILRNVQFNRFHLDAAKMQQFYNVLFLFTACAITFLVAVNLFYIGAFGFSRSNLIRLLSPLVFGLIGTVCAIWLERKPNVRLLNIVLALIGVLFVFLFAWRFITKTYVFDNCLTVTHHFDAYFYPVYKVFSGQTPLIDFKNLYGFYPYFLAPILKLMGGATMYHFSIIVAALVAICFLSIFISLFLLCKNKLLPVLCTIALMGWMVTFPGMYQGVFYLQYVPQRLLFPSILLLLCTLQATFEHKRNRTWFVGITYFIVALSLLWNFDTGFVVLIAYSAFLIYRALVVYPLNDKRLYRVFGATLASAAGSVLAAYVALFVITYLRTGQIFQLADVFYGQTIFYQSGFFMLRMPFVHIWIILILVYAVALVKSMKEMCFLRNDRVIEQSPFGAMYFLLSVLGLGLFSYYQGRSHDFVFTFVCWPGFVLLALFAQETLRNRKTTSLRNKIILVVSLVFLSALTGASVYSSYRTVKTTVQTHDYSAAVLADSAGSVSGDTGTETQGGSVYLDNALQVIDTFRQNKEPLNLITRNAATFYSVLGEPWVKPVPASIDWFERSDCEKVLETIRTADSIVIFDQDSFDVLSRFFQEELVSDLQTSYQTGKMLNGFYVFLPKSFGPETLENLPSDLAISDVQLTAAPAAEQ